MSLPIVKVVWDDAWVGSGVSQLKELEESKPIRTQTVGYLVADNSHGVVLVTDLYPDTPEEGHTPMFIPHGMVVSMTKVLENSA